MPSSNIQRSEKWVVIRITRDVQREIISQSLSMKETYDSVLRRVLKLKTNLVSRKDLNHEHPPKRTETTRG